MWKRYRRAVAWAEAALMLGLPFLKVNGLSAFRFDIPTLSLYFFGSVVRLSEFYFVLFGTLFFLVLIVWVTAIFGRVWCGWICPQTVLLDLAEDIAGWIFRKRNWGPKVVLLALSALVSASLMWYFIPPSEFFHEIFHSSTVTGFFVVQWIVIYLELAFAGRKFCKYVCPYSMLQTALFDRDTLVIAFKGRPEEFEGKRPCLMCHSCESACPVEIDIKQGLQRECIACAACIDSCKAVTDKSETSPFITYDGRIVRPKLFVLGGMTIVFGIIMVLSIVLSPPVSIIIKRDTVQVSPLVNSYSYTITNKKAEDVVVEFQVEGPYEFIGKSKIHVKGFGLLTGHFMLKSVFDTKKNPVIIVRTGKYILKQTVGYL